MILIQKVLNVLLISFIKNYAKKVYFLKKMRIIYLKQSIVLLVIRKLYFIF